jgi:signal transduction histidine kinase
VKNPAGRAITSSFPQPTKAARRETRVLPLAAIRDPALHAAAARILARWTGDATDTLSTEDVVFELVELGKAVESSNPPPLGAEHDTATLVLRGRLLQELRRETLKEWGNRGLPDATRMLAILNGFERAQASLTPAATDDFAKRLSEPGGLGLLVEVAHDLRSPLTSILFLAETLLRGQSGDLNEVQQHQLGIIYSAALSLVSTASDVIEIARGRERFEGTEPVPFSLTSVIEPVRDIVNPMAEEKGISLRISTATPDQRIGFPVALSRVLLNLTTNALKFTNEGFVEIAADAKGPTRIEFSVRDSGSGITPDALRTLFHPFRRRQGYGGGYYFSGTGLGLTICKKLVQAMGGELQLETETGVGTRFFFEIDAPPSGSA